MMTNHNIISEPTIPPAVTNAEPGHSVSGAKLLYQLTKDVLTEHGVDPRAPGVYHAAWYAADGSQAGYQIIRPEMSLKGGPKGRYDNPKGVKKGIFNLPKLYEASRDDVVFVTEAIPDALAFIAEGREAIALCGAGSRILIEACKHRKPQAAIAIAHDHDRGKHTHGQDTAVELYEELSKIGGIRVLAQPPEPYGAAKDAAEAYLAGSPALKEFIAQTAARAEFCEPNPEPDPAPRAKKKDKGNTAEMPEGMARHLALNADGGVMDTYDNHAAILLHDPRWAGRLTYDAMEHTGIILDFAQSPMGQVFINPEAHPTIQGAVKIRNADMPHIRAWITREYELRGRAAFGDGFELACQSRAFHPIKDMLNAAMREHANQALIDLCRPEAEPELGSLEVDRLLTDYIGAAPTPFTYAVTRIHMIAAAGRIFNPGVKYDHVLVLWSPMGGIGKTTLVERLFDPWYTTFEEFSGTEMHRAMSTTWCALYEELSINTKADADAIKRTLSARADRVRELYKNQNDIRRRQCIFWATANRPQVLEEEAGNRRFINVECGLTPPRLDYDQTCAELDAKRELIWAQAAFLYRTYYAARAGGIELRRDWDNELKANQAAAREIPAWEQVMTAALDTPVPPGYDRYSPEQRRCFWAWSLNYTPLDEGRPAERRIERPWLDSSPYAADRDPLRGPDMAAWRPMPRFNLPMLISDLCDCPSLKGITVTRIGRWIAATGHFDRYSDGKRRMYVRRATATQAKPDIRAPQAT